MEAYWKATGISNRFIGELHDYCIHHKEIEKVILFGSRARGDYHKTSDIDLAVFTRNLSHTQQNLIEESIHELSTLLKIDVLFINRLTKVKLLSNIQREGVIIYEQGEALREA
ncbi:nucleotidyltransferase domain-containing protein [Fictibacillus iocasae]|uniref:Nucleotidyltransferase domain-containing protein n=1 Tax=Fictibacillus iocasae TaxID=2715437 RepID=A0ABW2NT41_9BACL